MILQFPFPMGHDTPPPNHRNHFRDLKKLSKFLPKIVLRAYRSFPTKQICPGAEGSEQARPLRPRRCYCPSRGIDFGAWKQTCLPQKMDGIMMAFQSFRMFWRLNFGKQQKAFQKTWFDEIRSCPLFGGNSLFGKTMLEGFHLYYRMIMYFP